MRLLSLFLIALMLFSCEKKSYTGPPTSINAFYYWQTSLNSFDWGNKDYTKLKVNKIYYRFFDVDWSEEAKAPVPVSPLSIRYQYRWHSTAELVPVVFITNETFSNISREESVQLARHIHKKVMGLLTTLFMDNEVYHLYKNQWWEQDPYQIKTKHFNELHQYDSIYQFKVKSIREIQFDCDWTKTTRDKYFAFLEEAKNLFTNQQLSSTIRLHQYKHKKDTGIPPVDRGMLMCYNAGNVQNANESNSIFNYSQVMSYLTGTYPLPLDYALPIFEWALVFQQDKLKKITSRDQVKAYQSHLQEIEKNVFIVQEDFVLGTTHNSIYLRKGDKIKIETPDMSEVQRLATWIGNNRNNAAATLTLYHLNNHDITTHSKAIETIFNSF